MPVKTEQKVYAGLGLLFLILIAIVVSANRTVVNLVSDSDSVVRTVEATKALDDLAARLIQLPTNTAGSVVPDHIREALQNVRKLTAENERQQGRLDVLETLITAMINSPSQELMAEIQGNLGTLRNEEDLLLTERNAQSVKSAALTIIVIRVGALVGLFAVLVFALMTRRDLQDGRRAQEELAHFFDVSLDLFCIRGFDGRFKLVNSAWERTLGYTREEVLHKPYTDLIHPDDIEPTRARVKQLTQGKNTIAFDNRYRTKDGDYRWLRWNATALHEKGLIYAAARDITERREAEGSRARHAAEVALVSETMDVLQSCDTIADAYKAINQMAKKLFPNISGAIYHLAASRNILERVATWGSEVPAQAFIGPGDCLSLKRGRAGITPPDSPLHCQHAHEFKAPYVCVPMVALNDTMGMLHLRQETDSIPITEGNLTFAITIAEHIALTLANLRLRDTLRVQSIRDPLTSLFNRRYLEESLEREIHRASRNGTPLSVLMLDLDHFKAFNDSFGHDAGDAVLREWGGFLQVRVRFEDIVCRLGGEEFAIVLPDASMESAQDVAQRICLDARSLTVTHRNQTLGPITVSIGIACFPANGANGETLLHTADKALYQAKSSGRNQVVLAL